MTRISPLRYVAEVLVPHLTAHASDAVVDAIVADTVADAWLGELHWRKEQELRHLGSKALFEVRKWLTANEERERAAVAKRAHEWAWAQRAGFTAAWIATWWMSREVG